MSGALSEVLAELSIRVSQTSFVTPPLATRSSSAAPQQPAQCHLRSSLHTATGRNSAATAPSHAQWRCTSPLLLPAAAAALLRRCAQRPQHQQWSTLWAHGFPATLIYDP